MANYDKHSDDFSASRVISIIRTTNRDNYTLYEVRIRLAHIEWTVSHRYSEFHDLHEKLVSDYKLDKSLLPPKKYFGNQSEGFIKKRQKQLEIYLQTLLRNLVNVPPSLGDFLHFNRYEIHGITHELAKQLFHNGDQILQRKETFLTNPLQLYSLCNRMQLPSPTCDTGDVTQDIGHILDFFTRVECLGIEGSTEACGASNIVPNQLAFHLQNFKSLQQLKIVSCNLGKVTGVEHVKKSLKSLSVHNSLKALKEVLLIDIGFAHWLAGSTLDSSSPAWDHVTSANFRSNDISYIDESVKLLPSVRDLDLSFNKLHEIQELQHLLQLTHVNLSHNNLRTLHALHTKLGNIRCLQLAGNSIESLRGFAKLYSLEILDVSNNQITQLSEVSHLSGLPCLESLDLRSNEVTTELDYRTKVLGVFRDRAKEVTLDGEKASHKELDTVAVLLAIEKSKAHANRQTDTNRQTDSRGQASSRATAAMDQSLTASAASLSSRHLAAQVDSDPDVTEVGQIADESLGEEGSEAFKQEVERIRAEGGNAWLTLLNRMHQVQEYVAEPDSPQGQAHKFKFQYEGTGRQTGRQTDGQTGRQTDGSVRESGRGRGDSESEESVDSSTDSSDDLPTPRSDPTFLLPEGMPTKNDATFISHLQLVTPSTYELGRRSRTETSHRDERPVHLMWSPCVRYTAPSREFPACVYITTESIHIFEVISLTSDFEVPELRHVYCVPLMNIQQVALGYRGLSIRVEEAFVGPPGTFTFLSGNASKTDGFLDALKLAYRRAVPDLDQYEDPHVVASPGTEGRLRGLLGGEERVAEVDIIAYMLVHLCRDQSSLSRVLVITSRCLYILREDNIFYPQTTFAAGPPSHPQFQILARYPMSSKICDFQMYDSDTYSPDQALSLANTFSATNTSAMLSPNFIGYGTKLTFQAASGPTQQLDIRVSTPNVRNKFLEALTSARSKLAERSPSKVKFKDTEGSSGEDRRRKKHKAKSGRKKGKGQRSWSGKQVKGEGHRIEEVNEVSEVSYDIGTLKRESPTGESADNSESVDDVAIRLVATSQGETENYNSSDLEGDVTGTVIGGDVRPGDVTGDVIGGDVRPGDVTGAVIGGDVSPRDATEDTIGGDVRPGDVTGAAIGGDVRPGDVTGDVIGGDVTGAMIGGDVRPGDVTGDVIGGDVKGAMIGGDVRPGNVTEDVIGGDVTGAVIGGDVRLAVSGGDLSRPDHTDITHTTSSSGEIVRPQTLGLGYPSMDLLTHLTSCNEDTPPCLCLSDPLQELASMTGEETVNYFHAKVSQIGREGEELKHLLWTEVVPYTNARQSLHTCVLLSNTTLYFLSDTLPVAATGHAPWRKHVRYRSDTSHLQKALPLGVGELQTLSSGVGELHTVSGIIHKPQSMDRVRVYCSLPLTDLTQVHVGLFDQSFRLTGTNAQQVFCCLTRDSGVTECFIRRLMAVLATLPTPSPLDLSASGSDNDFYKRFRSLSRTDSLEYTHPSNVRFVYPKEDVVKDLSFVIGQAAYRPTDIHQNEDKQRAKNSQKPKNKQPTDIHILAYLLVYSKIVTTDINNVTPDTVTPDTVTLDTRSLVLSPHHLTLVVEDYVSYPLPDFAREPPPHKQHLILETRSLRHLKRVQVSGSHDLRLVFTDECEEICVDAALEYYSPCSGRVGGRGVEGRGVEWLVRIQNTADRERVIKLLSGQWSDINGEELPVYRETSY